MKDNIKALASATVLTSSVCFAHAQDDHQTWIKLGASLFGNDEKNTYGSFAVGKDLGDHFRIQLGVTTSPFRSFTESGVAVRYGGSDAELLGTYLWSTFVPLELSLGVDQPRTPARTDTALSYRILANLPGRAGLKWWADAYGIAGVDSIAMIGVGGTYSLTSKLKLEISGALPIQGNNSVSSSSGNLDRLGVYSAGVALPMNCGKYEASLGFAITNQVGWTTGMSATPTLGGFPGLNISYGVRF